MIKKTLLITPWGIEGSSKMVNYEEGCTTYFGEDSNINQVRKIFILILYNYRIQ